MTQNTLEIKNLHTSFFTEKGELKAVDDVSLTVPAGSIVGIVGESGCGKSVTARSVMGLLKPPGRIVSGQILLNGRDLLSLSEKEYCAVRGNEVSMIFQEPMTSLNPVLTIGRQVEEVLILHKKIPHREARAQAVEILNRVGIPDAAQRISDYPHQLSGGLRQRVMIAMAMICRPSLLIADEPTTALDVTVEAQILRLMKDLCAGGTSILIISHNLGVIAQLCDQVYVMYAGQIVEKADVFTLFDDPRHPYTKGLLEAVTALREDTAHLATIPGVVPNLLHLPEGCRFHLRCADCSGLCKMSSPDMREISPGHRARCISI